MIISKNLFNLDLRTITRTGHNFTVRSSKRFRLLRTLTSSIRLCASVSSSSSSFITLLSLSLCLSHDIYLFFCIHSCNANERERESLISSAARQARVFFRRFLLIAKLAERRDETAFSRDATSACRRAILLNSSAEICPIKSTSLLRSGEMTRRMVFALLDRLSAATTTTTMRERKKKKVALSLKFVVSSTMFDQGEESVLHQGTSHWTSNGDGSLSRGLL